MGFFWFFLFFCFLSKCQDFDENLNFRFPSIILIGITIYFYTQTASVWGKIAEISVLYRKTSDLHHEKIVLKNFPKEFYSHISVMYVSFTYFCLLHINKDFHSFRFSKKTEIVDETFYKSHLFLNIFRLIYFFKIDIKRCFVKHGYMFIFYSLVLVLFVSLVSTWIR